MKAKFLILSLLGIFLGDTNALPPTLGRACEKVSVNLLENQNKNIVICPLGIVQTLSPFVRAADRKIQKEILKYFHVSDLKEDDIYQLAHWLEKQSFSSKTYCLPSYELPQLPFSLFKALGLQVSTIDYKNPLEAQKKINQMVEQDTSGHIKDLIKASQLNPSTLMILLNTFSLQKPWTGTFTKAQMIFMKKENVPAVKSSTGQYIFHKKLTLAKFQLKDRVSFVIKMSPLGPRPITTSDLALFAGAQHLLEEAEYQYVLFPAFHHKSSLDLRTVMKKSLPLLLEKPFKLSFLESKVGIDFYQQSNEIKVTEEGIAAFSATAVSVGLRSTPPQKNSKGIVFDRPFSWALVKELDGQNLILMAGYFFTA